MGVLRHHSCVFATVLVLLVWGAIVAAPGSSVRAANDTITVGATVPSQSTGSGNSFAASGSGGNTSQQKQNPQEQKKDARPVVTGVIVLKEKTRVTISWSASDDVGIQNIVFRYGTTADYGNSSAVTGAYAAVIASPAPDTAYFYKITVTDTAGQATEYAGTFNTTLPADAIPPVISDVSLATTATGARIIWKTDEPAASQVQYGRTGTYGQSAVDANLSTEHKLDLADLLPNTQYHFRLFATDASGNSAVTGDAALTTLKSSLPLPDVRDVQVTPLASSLALRWQNPDPSVMPDFAGVQVLRKIGSAPRTTSDGEPVYRGTGEQLTDTAVQPNVQYFYGIFSFNTSDRYSGGVAASGELVPTAPNQEMCNNYLDDDDDGVTDCADSDCVLSSFCKGIVPEQPLPQIPVPAVPPDSKLRLGQFRFFASNRRVPLAITNGSVSDLAGLTFTIAIRQEEFKEIPDNLVLIIDHHEQHQLVLDPSEKVYYSDLIFPLEGAHESFIGVGYPSGATDMIPVLLNSLPWGTVTDEQGTAISDAVVQLVYKDGTIVPTLASYNETNPFITSKNGVFGWVLENGEYYARVQSNGFYGQTIPLTVVRTNVFNPTVQLVLLPPSPLSVIDPNKPVIENVQNVVKNLSLHAVATIKALQNAADDPQVEKAASTVVAPTAVGVAVVSTAPFLSATQLVQLARLFFLQPLLLLGRRKRHNWGQVYNSLNKLPVDLAIVRLVDNATGRIVQSRVTDKHGRYYFTVNPGNYRMEVVKDQMSFPSSLLKNFQSDGQKPDIYHGEKVTVNDKYPAITANIPVDPAGENKTPRRLLWERFGRRVQGLLSRLGLVASVISFYISPQWYVGLLLGAHVVVGVIFHRLAVQKKPKNWGIVYDTQSRKPLVRAVVRLFSAQFNKLVNTQITDGQGRYYFLAGDNKYFVTYDHKEYQPNKTPIIDLSGKDIEVIGSKMGLVKKGAAPPPAPRAE